MNLSGSPFDFVLAFLAGVLLSFTPCVYPLIPITVAYIGGNAANSKRKGFTLSLSYVTGVAVTYSLLGLVASLSGQIFGRISTHPITYIIVGAVIIIFGLSMLDVISLRFWPNLVKPSDYKRGNHLSAFVLGLTSGLIVAPCLTPALAAILAYLTTKKNIIYAMVLLFSFAYGMGFILLIVGTFSGLLTAMPKPGKWLQYVKGVGAFILLAAGAYLIFSGIRRI